MTPLNGDRIEVYLLSRTRDVRGEAFRFGVSEPGALYCAIYDYYVTTTAFRVEPRAKFDPLQWMFQSCRGCWREDNPIFCRRCPEKARMLVQHPNWNDLEEVPLCPRCYCALLEWLRDEARYWRCGLYIHTEDLIKQVHPELLRAWLEGKEAPPATYWSDEGAVELFWKR